MNTHKSLQQHIEERITKEGIQPKPFWYFAALLVGIFVVGCTTLLLSIYIANLLGVLAQTHEYMRVLDHGTTGALLLLSSLPFALLGAFVFSFVILLTLLRNYFALYQFSLIKTVIVSFIVIVLSGYIFVRLDTSLLFLRLFGIESQSLKVFHNHYLGGKQGHIVHGTIVAIEGDTLSVILASSDKTILVNRTSSTTGLRIENTNLPHPVFMLVDTVGTTTRALYIGHIKKGMK